MKAVAAFLLVLCHLAISHAWVCEEAPVLYNAVQIDAGNGKVVVTDKNGIMYFLTESSWTKMSDIRFNHSSVGNAGIWATGQDNQVHKYANGVFQPASGLTLRQIDAGGAGQVVGVTSSNLAYCLRSSYASAFAVSGSLSWSYLSIGLKYISCGPYGCWGISTSNLIYYTSSFSPTTCSVRWGRVSGTAVKVEVGSDGNIFIITTTGLVQQRTSISSRSTVGRSWSTISTCAKVRHMSYDLRVLWVLTNSGLIMKCRH